MPNLKQLQTLFWRPRNISVAINGHNLPYATVRSHTPQVEGFICFSLSPTLGLFQRGWKWGKKRLNPKVTGCFSKCHSLPEQGWVMTSGEVTALNSVSKILFPDPKLTLASQWEMQQSSGGFRPCPALQAAKLCIYNINYFSFPSLVKRFARIPSAHLRHQKTLKSEGIDFVTEGEVVDGGFGNGRRTWA